MATIDYNAGNIDVVFFPTNTGAIRFCEKNVGGMNIATNNEPLTANTIKIGNSATTTALAGTVSASGSLSVAGALSVSGALTAPSPATDALGTQVVTASWTRSFMTTFLGAIQTFSLGLRLSTIYGKVSETVFSLWTETAGSTIAIGNGSTITLNGNIGIGTTAPAYTLDVSGTALVKKTIGNTATLGKVSIGSPVTEASITANYMVASGPTLTNGEYFTTMTVGQGNLILSIPYALGANKTVNVIFSCRSNQPDMFFRITNTSSNEWLYTSPTLLTTTKTYTFTFTNGATACSSLNLYAQCASSVTNRQFIYSQFSLYAEPSNTLDVNGDASITGTALVAKTISNKAYFGKVGIGPSLLTEANISSGVQVASLTSSGGEYVATISSGNHFLYLVIPYTLGVNKKADITISCRSNRPDMYFYVGHGTGAGSGVYYTSPILSNTMTTYSFTITTNLESINLTLYAFCNSTVANSQFIYSQFSIYSEPSYALDVVGDAHCSGDLYVGYNTNNAGTSGEGGGCIMFGGTYQDNAFDNALIKTRRYAKTNSWENSELLLFKGYDLASGDNGPDRIRLRSANIVFDTYSSNTTDSSAESIRMTIDSIGNVGIGTTTPSYKLDVSGNSKLGAWLFCGTPSQESTNYNRLGTQLPMTNLNYAMYQGTTETIFNTPKDMFFRTQDTNKMTLLENGNFGIGTNTPAYTLDVSGTALVKKTIGNSATFGKVSIGSLFTEASITAGYQVASLTSSGGEYTATISSGTYLILKIPYLLKMNKSANITISCRSNRPDMDFYITHGTGTGSGMYYRSNILSSTTTTYNFTITNTSATDSSDLNLYALCLTTVANSQFIFSNFSFIPEPTNTLDVNGTLAVNTVNSSAVSGTLALGGNITTGVIEIGKSQSGAGKVEIGTTANTQTTINGGSIRQITPLFGSGSVEVVIGNSSNASSMTTTFNRKNRVGGSFAIPCYRVVNPGQYNTQFCELVVSGANYGLGGYTAKYFFVIERPGYTIGASAVNTLYGYNPVGTGNPVITFTTINDTTMDININAGMTGTSTQTFISTLITYPSINIDNQLFDFTVTAL